MYIYIPMCVYIYIPHLHSFLWLSNIPLYGIFFVHSSADEHLGCFHILVIVINAAMSIRVHVSLQISVFIFF